MMNILEAIEIRHSVRSFTGVPLNENDRQIINAAISDASSPFEGKVQIELHNFPLRGTDSPGTYGTIKSCCHYILVAYDAEDEVSVLSAGYIGEYVVLEATRLGLGTCWLGATFKNKDFEAVLSLTGNNRLHEIIAIGYPREKRALTDRLTSFFAGSAKRKPFETLFSINSAGQFRQSLEAMRLAPSGMNLQPWRVFSEGNILHFYRSTKSAYSLIDSGIGLCHFHIAEKEAGHKGDFFISEHQQYKDLAYVISYRRD